MVAEAGTRTRVSLLMKQVLEPLQSTPHSFFIVYQKWLPPQGTILQPSGSEPDALPVAPEGNGASSGNRTRIICLEGRDPDHWMMDAQTLKWLSRQDLDLRMPVYQTSALTNFATRQLNGDRGGNRTHIFGFADRRLFQY